MIVGVYAAGRAGSTDSVVELIQRLAADPRVTGLEIPTHHVTNPQVRQTLSQLHRPDWVNALTCFPETMLAMTAAPGVGLAASNESARAAAIRRIVDIVETATEPAAAANSAGKVGEVFLHSAPGGGSRAAMRQSLLELLTRFPHGPAFAIEHCDAAAVTHSAEKGFLSLDDELSILSEFGGRVGVVVNWGRSVIEGRDIATAGEHVRRCAKAGLLRRVMFSSVADVPTSYGPAWSDGHLPTSTVEPASLLTPNDARALVRACPPEVAFGVKVSVRPVDADDDRRFDVIEAVLDDVLERQLGSASPASAPDRLPDQREKKL